MPRFPRRNPCSTDPNSHRTAEPNTRLRSHSSAKHLETAAHIHGPATIGVNAAIIFPFALGTPKNGTFGPLTALEELYLNSGQLYVNIQSNLFPGGEIRGQILPNPIACTVPVEERTWGAIKALYETQ